MGDLFSTFNPETVILGLTIRLNWVARIRIIFILPQIFWLQKRKPLIGLLIIIEYLSKELEAVFGVLIKPGFLLRFITMFFSVLSVNFLGLIPYVFTSSRHLSFTLSLALPLWTGYIINSLIIQFDQNIRHLVPEGTPGALIPLMVVIESVRLLIRPFTLAVRLAANIIAGHLLLSLLGGQGYGLRIIIFICLITALRILILLECAVACIQAYVFMILSGLYSNEHNSKRLNRY